MQVIDKIQNQLESIYAIKVGEQAADYLIDGEELKELMPKKTWGELPKELFLVNPRPQNDTLEVALYLHSDLKLNLIKNNPFDQLTPNNLNDFCTAIEGISHFVYYLHKSNLKFPVSELELELQAEIDKYILLALLIQGACPQHSLLDTLFENYRLNAGLSTEQQERYYTASELARSYCFKLSQVLRADLKKFFHNIRSFYPLNLEQKIQCIFQ